MIELNETIEQVQTLRNVTDVQRMQRPVVAVLALRKLDRAGKTGRAASYAAFVEAAERIVYRMSVARLRVAHAAVYETWIAQERGDTAVADYYQGQLDAYDVVLANLRAMAGAS